MVSGRLKDIIYKKLCEDLSHVEIIEYKGEIWFIDREDKFWYFIYNKSNGEMWWRYSFFTPFFSLFSLPSNEFTSILSFWVEEVLNHKVTTIQNVKYPDLSEVEEVLNCKVTTTLKSESRCRWKVEEVLNCKVTTTNQGDGLALMWVEEVLNCKVTTTKRIHVTLNTVVEEVLSYKINKTGGAFYNTTYVEEVLNNEV